MTFFILNNLSTRKPIAANVDSREKSKKSQPLSAAKDLLFPGARGEPFSPGDAVVKPW